MALGLIQNLLPILVVGFVHYLSETYFVGMTQCAPEPLSSVVSTHINVYFNEQLVIPHCIAIIALLAIRGKMTIARFRVGRDNNGQTMRVHLDQHLHCTGSYFSCSHSRMQDNPYALQLQLNSQIPQQHGMLPQ